MRTGWFRPALALLAASAFLPLGAATATTFSEPAVDAAVQVTTDAGAARGHAIPALAVHPDDPQTLVIAEGDAHQSRCFVRVSRNGGLSWSTANQPQTPADWPGCGYSVTGALADLEFAPDGTLYYAFSAFQPTTYQQRIYLARSTDVGLTWETSALPRIGPDPGARQMGADAMPSIVVDREDPNHVYVAWWSNNGTWNLPSSISGAESSVWCRLVDNRFLARPWLSASTDGGRTFSPPVDMAPGIGHCTTEPYLVQGPDGEILAFFGEATRTLEEGKAPPAHLFFSTSRDGGKTFTVRPIHEQGGTADGRAATSTSDWLGATSPAVDLETGNIYVTWESLGEAVPQVLFKRSTDGGRTWSEPVKVNDGDPKRDWDFPEQFPTMAVAPNGRIDIVWYDWRNDPGYNDGDTRGSFQDVYYAYSTDGGRTFAENVRLNDRLIDRRFGPYRQGSIRGPLGLAATDKAVYAAWDDTRNGNEATATQDIYFTRARWAPASEVFGGRTETGMSPVAAGLLGSAITLAVGGIVLVMITRMAAGRRADDEQVSRPAPRPVEPSLG